MNRMRNEDRGHSFESPSAASWSVRVLPLALALAIAAPLRAQEGSLPLGSKAPGAVVETLDGKRVDLAQYIGKTPVLIEFWATWCPNCQALEPAIKAAHKKYGRQVRFLGVAVSVNQTPQRARLYAQKHKLPLEVLFDRKGAATSAYNVFATSTIVVIDRKGTIVYTGQGGDQDIEAAIKKAL